MTSRADVYTRAGLIGSLALIALFFSVNSGIQFGLKIVEKALDSLPDNLVSTLNKSQ